MRADESDNVHALYWLDQAPSDFNAPHFRRYAGMKLGRDEDLDHYALQLASAADVIMRKASLEARAGDPLAPSWVLTAPAYYQLPAAANLLAQRVYALLRARGQRLRLHEQRLSAEQVRIPDLAAFRQTYNYCASSVEVRVAERQRLTQTTPPSHWLPFAGQQVLVLNDICVTGAQQHALQRELQRIGALSCHWLYVFHVERNLGLQHPAIEQQINHCAYTRPGDYASVLNSAASRPTVRCINRLFDIDDATFGDVVARLTTASCARLLQWIASEGRYDLPEFADRLQQLTAGLYPLHRNRHVSP